MAKKPSNLEDNKTVKIICFNKSEGAYGLSIYEIQESFLKEHAQKMKSYEPDIYAIFVNNLINATRDIFGL